MSLLPGRPPCRSRPNGPVISPEIDPQLAALADAFKIRVQIMQGSQSLVRGNATTRITKGDFRGFKVQRHRKIGERKVVSEEITVSTPKNGLIKTVNHVLADGSKDRFSRVSFPKSKMRDWNFFTLPAPAGKNVPRARFAPFAFGESPYARRTADLGKKCWRHHPGNAHRPDEKPA